MNTVLLGVIAYVLAQLALGVFFSRRIHTEDDYLVAGRSLGYGLATFTIFATWFGAETCIGAAGSIYADGLAGGTSDPFGYALCLLLMGAVFAVPLWRRKLTTLADLFRVRYSARVEQVAVIFMVPTSVLWAAAQIRAFGQVLAASSGLEVTLTITLAAAVVIAYTMFGGLLADAWTDVIQGIALMIGLALLIVVVFRDSGLGVLEGIETQRLNVFAHGKTSILALVEEWAVPVCGSVLAAELVARVIACRTPEIARRSSLLAGAVYICIGVIPVTVGLIGYTAVPGLEHPEQILPLMAQKYLHPLPYTLFAGALVSAILSTVDSALLVASSLVSHNLIVPLRPGMPERRKVLIARAGVAVFGALAYVMALFAGGVYSLVEEASAFGSGGVFTVVVLGLFTRWGGVPSAFAALFTGMGTWITGAYILDLPYPYITSLGAALAAYSVAALFKRSTTPE